MATCHVTVEQFLISKQVPFGWLDSQEQRPEETLIENAEYTMAPNKPKAKRSNVAGDSPVALFLKSQGVDLPKDATSITFVDSERLQICAARVRSTVKELKANGLLNNLGHQSTAVESLKGIRRRLHA